MSSRFNPVAFLTKRRSRSKSKTRTNSRTTSESATEQNNGFGQQETTAVEPHVTTKPARMSVKSPQPKSPRPYFRVFSSLRRTRSPRRSTETGSLGSPARAESVPPGRNDPPDFENRRSEQPHDPQSADDETKSPAPLAQSDCFELTDVSEPETDEAQVRIDQSKAHAVEPDLPTETGSEQTDEPSQSEADIQSVIERDDSQDYDEEKSIDESMQFEKSDDEDQDTCCENTHDTVEGEDEQSVTKLSVEYETEYPVCEPDSDNTLSAPDSQLGDEWVLTDEKEAERTSSSETEEDSRPEVQFSSSDQSLAEQQDEYSKEGEMNPSVIIEHSEEESLEPSEQFQVLKDDDTELHETNPVETDCADETTPEVVKTGPKIEQAITKPEEAKYEFNGARPEMERQDEPYAQGDSELDYEEPEFEIPHDPAQDPFHEVELAATAHDWNSGTSDIGLPVPSIIVTSASSQSLEQHTEPEPLSRAPPPVPPPPSSVPPHRPPPPPTGPPPRPASSPTHSHVGETGKKKKLFGVVDVGPLPSDPDPNFPFRKHLEKSVVPNPKKAIQRIIRGETKAERRQRKEQDELNRLLKSTSNKEVKPAEKHSEDWEFFQELSAQIEHTVHESASKVKALIPTKPHPLEQGGEEEEAETEDWAHFDAAFGSETEPTAVPIFNPWEDKKETVAASEVFDLKPEEDEDEGNAEGGIDVLVQLSDETDTSALKEEEQDDITNFERALGADPLPEYTTTEIIQDIDTFLGIEDTKEQYPQEPLSSDPLKLIECLTQKPEVNPLEELGLDLNPTESMATGIVNDPADLNLANFDTEGQQKGDNLPEDSSEGSVSPSIQEPDVPPPNDNVELNNSETEHEDILFTKQELDLPNSEDPDRSDVEDSAAADDVLWGGFGEIHAEPDGPNESEPNPFGLDDFGSVPVNPEDKKQLNKDTIRPRAKPVRQETLSGNNPFRKRGSDDDELLDELTRVAASIELTGLQHKNRKRHDSFESSGGSIGSDTLEVEQNLHTETEHVEEVFVDPTDQLENTEILTQGFDPLQTIYPESDNESIPSEEHNQPETEPISIIIKDKPKVSNEAQAKDTGEVPILEAPPRPAPVQAVATKTEAELISIDNNEVGEPAVKHATPAGWVDFNSESADTLDETDKQLVPSELTFEVDWSAPVTRPEKNEPEPPRPETPDPELDIPFYPVAKDEVFYRLWLRYPEKKTRIKQVSKYTTDRYWREIAICFRMEHERKVIDLHEVDEKTDTVASDPYRSIRIEPYMQLSREKLQQYDKYGKLHVFKLNHVTYREMVGIRPEKFSLKNLQHLVTHKPKQNVAVDHLPIYTELLKFGSLDQKKVRELMCVFEDALMHIPAHKDTSLIYNREEVCCYVVDEYQAHVSADGIIRDQKARTRILCTAFVNGGPHIVLGLNDKWRFGREVVRRSDILPVMHDEWISIRNPEFHSCVELDAYEVDHMLKFYPLDGCRFELLRFRVSLRGNRELPMQVRTTYGIDGRRVSMRCELLVPGFFSACNRKGAVACENVEIHIPVPEDWIYHFRVEKHHKYGSVHSTLRKPGRIKGLERITQMAQSLLPPSILEASIGLAKYEHLYKAIVWRIPRIPEKHEASLRPHLLTCKLTLAQHDTVPEWDTLVPDCQVEYTMPSSTVSGATVRSISVEHTGVAEKFVKYTSKYKYTVDIDYRLGERKEPPLKSMLDEQEAPVEQELEGTTPVEHPEQQPEEPLGNEVADLLGLGLDFSEPTENHQPDSKNAQEAVDGSDLL